MSAKDRKYQDAPQEAPGFDSGIEPAAQQVEAAQDAPQEGDELRAIEGKIASLEKEVNKLKKRHNEIIERRYSESVDKPVAHAQRSRDITKILREARGPGEDAVRGHMRQMQAQIAQLGQQQS